MLHVIYILAFTVLAFLAIGNLIRSMVTISMNPQNERNRGTASFRRSGIQQAPHPELLDDLGNLTDEPLLVMKSIEIDDAREQLDALYRLSPGSSTSDNGEPV